MFLIREIPSLEQASTKEIVELLKSELGLSEVYIYPILPTLVAVYDHEPTEKELKFPKMVRKVLSSPEPFTALYIGKEKTYVFIKDPKNKLSFKELKTDPSSIGATLMLSFKTYYLLESPELQSIVEQAKELVLSRGNKVPELIPVKTVKVSEDDLKEVIREKHLGDLIREKVRNLKNNPTLYRWVKVGIAGAVVLGLLFGGAKFYRSYKEKQKLAQLEKRKKQLITAAQYNAGAFILLTKGENSIVSFTYDGKRLKGYEKSPVLPVKFRWSENLMSFELSVKPTKPLKTDTKLKDFFKQIDYRGSKKDFYFTVYDLKQLKPLFARNGKLYLEGFKGDGVWNLHGKL